MSGGVVLTLMALAQQLKQMSDLIRQCIPMEPGAPITPLPVSITPELSEPVCDIVYFSETSTEYVQVFAYIVEKGYKLYLSQIGIAPEDSNTKSVARYMIKLAGEEIKDLKLIVPVDVDFFWLQLFEGTEVSVHVLSTDGTTVCGNALYSGRRVRVPPQFPKI